MQTKHFSNYHLILVRHLELYISIELSYQAISSLIFQVPGI